MQADLDTLGLLIEEIFDEYMTNVIIFFVHFETGHAFLQSIPAPGLRVDGYSKNYSKGRILQVDEYINEAYLEDPSVATGDVYDQEYGSSDLKIEKYTRKFSSLKRDKEVRLKVARVFQESVCERLGLNLAEIQVEEKEAEDAKAKSPYEMYLTLNDSQNMNCQISMIKYRIAKKIGPTKPELLRATQIKYSRNRLSKRVSRSLIAIAASLEENFLQPVDSYFGKLLSVVFTHS